jgi:hypothetical protein
MRFEWDEAKRAANTARHGVDFTAIVDSSGKRRSSDPIRGRIMASCARRLLALSERDFTPLSLPNERMMWFA